MIMKKRIKLTEIELAEIKGGNQALICPDDVTNKNSVQGCICWYNNNSAILNDNAEMGCTCECR